MKGQGTLADMRVKLAGFLAPSQWETVDDFFLKQGLGMEIDFLFNLSSPLN